MTRPIDTTSRPHDGDEYDQDPPTAPPPATWIVGPDGAADGQLTAFRRRQDDYAAAFLVGYSNKKTRESYEVGLRQWFAYCDRMGFEPLNSAMHQVQLWIRDLELAGRAPRTIAIRLTGLRLFYAYLRRQKLTTGDDPTDGIKRPKIPRCSPTGVLTAGQMLDLTLAARATGNPQAYALVCILNFNGLRIGELCGTDVEDLTWRDGWPYLHVIRKGGDHDWVELDRTTELALRGAIGGRASGPLLLTRYQTRMTQQCASRILRNLRPLIRNAPDRLHPHMLRHSWATEGMRSGVPRQQMIVDGGWADGRMLDEVYNHAIRTPGAGAAHRIAASVLSG